MSKHQKNKNDKGFSLLELIISMIVMMILLAAVSTLISSALSTRSRETQRSDALAAARAALNVISREIANSGFGIKHSTTGLATNGLVLADSNQQRIHFNSNIVNTNAQFCDEGEDITYFYDASIESIVRYERFCSDLNNQTSIVVNRVSNVQFTYYNYVGGSSAVTTTTTPTANTGRVTVRVTVQMDPVQGQPTNEVVFTSDVTLRNANYMLNQY